MDYDIKTITKTVFEYDGVTYDTKMQAITVCERDRMRDALYNLNDFAPNLINIIADYPNASIEIIQDYIKRKDARLNTELDAEIAAKTAAAQRPTFCDHHMELLFNTHYPYLEGGLLMGPHDGGIIRIFDDLKMAVDHHIDNGHNISGIKLIRSCCGTSLLESKNWYEDYKARYLAYISAKVS